MSIVEQHFVGVALAATVATVIGIPAIGVGVSGIDNLTILVTNTGGSNSVTSATLERSLDPAGARFSPADASVIIPGGSLAHGASWEISYPSNWPAAYWLKLTLTSTVGTTVTVDILGHSFSVGVV